MIRISIEECKGVLGMICIEFFVSKVIYGLKVGF